MDLDPVVRTYIAESRELLEEMEDALLRLEQEDDKQESLNAIFRAAHTIKGSAGLFGLDDIVAFTHGVETLLDKLREGTMSVNADITALLLACRDHISDLIDQLDMVGGEELHQTLKLKGTELTGQLKKLGVGTRSDIPATLAQSKEPPVERVASGGQVGNDNWHISLRFGRNSLRDGMDPISFLRYLGTLGEIINISTLPDALPPAERMDPEACYLGFEINFKSNADKQSIESAFEFIRQDSLVRILPPRSLLSDYVRHIEELPEEDMRLGEILLQSGSLTQAELDEALRLQAMMNDRNISRPLGNIVVDSGMTTQTVIDA
ncbi:MAG TPA: Hpt domain-containing protein, partial [Gammaproteobacteria bacterium]